MEHQCEGDHRSADQKVRDLPPLPNPDSRGELDGVLRDHEAPSCGYPRDGVIQFGQSLPTYGEGG